MTWGTVKRDQLSIITGEVRRIPHANRVRSFAACCGTHVFFEDSREAETVDVTIASLDDPTPFPPEMSIWTEDRLPWVALNETRPVFLRSRRDG